MPKKFVLASSNPGKVREIQALLTEQDIEIVPQSAFGIADVAETGSSFIENALIKARHASRLSGLPAIADDSGLAVDALNGAPGVRSARFAGEKADDDANNAKLLNTLTTVDAEKRSARFHCVMVFLRHPEDPCPLIAQGVWEGQILPRAQGTGGFGYDPLFYVPDQGCSAAQLCDEDKNRLSHRGQATRALLAQLR